MKFDPNIQPYASERLTLGAARGVVATGNPLAAQAGLDMLKKASKIALMNAMIGFDIKENYSFKV